ncbi:MAG: methyltransferase domain-containing protein [Candidatus Nomurabacteria bacterium]|nr:methyltransferase domain-containing protein [Candidatus Nomurabacteria bacterium]
MFPDPVKILQNFGLADSMIVADLGAGSGFYSIHAGKMVPNGKVYAIDIQKDFLTTIKINSESDNLNNIETIWGDIEKIGGTNIAENIVDVVILSNVLFMAQNKKKVIKEAHRILKSGGRVLFIDWSETPSPFSPKSEMLFLKPDAHKHFTEELFMLDKEISAGEHHYGMIFRKK